MTSTEVSRQGRPGTMTSTAIQCLTYLADEQVLEVVFSSGETYLYENIPAGIPKLLTDADAVNRNGGPIRMSVGSLFHFLIRQHPDKYPCYHMVQGVPVPVSPPAPPRRPKLQPRDSIRKLLDRVKAKA